MPDFWTDSGYRLLGPGPRGHLAVGDDFLRAYFMRPELSKKLVNYVMKESLHQSKLQGNEELIFREVMSCPEKGIFTKKTNEFRLSCSVWEPSDKVGF